MVRRDGFDRLGPGHVLVHQANPTPAHRAKFMHEYTGDRKDSLRISVDNFSSDSVKLRLKDIVKVKDKKRGFTITCDMYVDGKCPKVGIYFPCTTYTLVLPSCKFHLI